MEKFWSVLTMLVMMGSLIFLILGMTQFEIFFIVVGILTFLASYRTYRESGKQWIISPPVGK